MKNVTLLDRSGGMEVKWRTKRGQYIELYFNFYIGNVEKVEECLGSMIGFHVDMSANRRALTLFYSVNDYYNWRSMKLHPSKFGLKSHM